jgi:putative ABC transport system permease protein
VIRTEIRRFFKSAKILTGAGIIILAIGVGASALAFSLLFASSSLVVAGMRHIGYSTVAEESGDGGSIPISWRQFEKLRALSGEHASLAAYSVPINVNLDFDGQVRAFTVAGISNSFFSTFTEPLSAGRDFTDFEVEQTTHHLMILSYRSAVDLFGQPSRALGQFLSLSGTSFEITGVAPPQFKGTLGASSDGWISAHSVIPLLIQVPAGSHIRTDAWKDMSSFYAIAASSQISSKALSALLAGFLRTDRAKNLALHSAQGLTRDSRRDENVRQWLRLGIYLSCALTMLTSLNYSLLLLARVPRYFDEVRLKRALGADVKALLIDLSVGPCSMMLISLMGAGIIYLLGLEISLSLSGIFGDIIHGSWLDNFLAFGIQVPFVCALTILIALLPILGVFRDTGAPRSGQSTTASHNRQLLLQTPVIVQIALCVCIWILSGMVFSSSMTAIRTPLGYQPAHLKVVYLEPRSQGVTFHSDGKNSFPSYAAMNGILESARAIPGVRNVAFSSNAPLQPKGYAVQLQRPDNLNSNPLKAYEIRVSPGYFRTIGTRIIRGRTVVWHGTMSADNEIVISDLLAHELWPGQDPINQRVSILYPAFAGRDSFSYPARVVGVAENIHLSGPSSTPDATFFSSISSNGFTVTSCVIIDGTAQLHDLQNMVDVAVSRLVPDLKVGDSTNVWDDLQATLRPEKERLYFALCSGLVMGCLAYIGLYSALRYYVQVRTRELAIRICLGASPWDIRKIVLRRATWSAGLAVALSVTLWPLIAQLSFSDYLGHLQWSTPRAILILLVCVAVALCVSLLPARGAVSVSPSEVLKEQ